MPDQGLAPWVSANDKPSTTAGNKPVSGDAAERRLKGEVMQLPARDRRRIKDIVQNDVSLLTTTAIHAGVTDPLSSSTHSTPWQMYLQTRAASNLPRPPRYQQAQQGVSVA